MTEKIYLNELFSYYKELLTAKQKDYFMDYYYNDLSLSEISENYHVSRNAVYNEIKIVVQKLYNYENKLNLCDKKKRVLSIIKDKEISAKIEEIL